MKTLRLHWSSSIKNGKKKFGDWLSPILIHHLSGMEVVHAKPNTSDLVAVGSLLQKLKNNFWNRKTSVWGSGLIAEHPPIKTIHTFYAIRGKKSAYIIKNTEIKTFGDPGLLVDLLLPNYKNIEKNPRLGLFAIIVILATLKCKSSDKLIQNSHILVYFLRRMIFCKKSMNASSFFHLAFMD